MSCPGKSDMTVGTCGYRKKRYPHVWCMDFGNRRETNGTDDYDKRTRRRNADHHRDFCADSAVFASAGTDSFFWQNVKDRNSALYDENIHIHYLENTYE